MPRKKVRPDRDVPGRVSTCDCGWCRKCKNREYQQLRREKLKAPRVK